MGPVRQNPIQRTVRTAHLSVLMTVHNFQYTTHTAQNSSDNLPSYLQTIIIAQMLSLGGKGGDDDQDKKLNSSIFPYESTAACLSLSYRRCWLYH